MPRLAPPRLAAVVCSMAVLTLPLLASGCGVQQSKYDQLVTTNRSLQEQLVRVEDERDAAKANLDTLRQQLGMASGELNALRGKYNLSEEEMQRLLAEYEDLMQRVSGLAVGALPEDMEAALQQLASQYPELLSFDAKRGMLRFASDFTFALGSADLNPAAATTLQQVARILNSESGSSFEARIVGHTDNVPITQAGTKAKHPTNWHLSAHRAISVGQSLIGSGVKPTRVQVAGYGEFRPVVANPARGGAAQNRRVEIYLLPMPDLEVQPPTATAAQPAIDEPMK